MVSATSLGQRLRLLEDDLTAVPSRIAVYHDMPFAIFRYDPDEEFAMRAELRLLLIRLQAQHGREPITISLADLLWESLADVGYALEDWFAMEEAQGLQSIVDTINAVLAPDEKEEDGSPSPGPLVRRIIERLSGCDPKRAVAFLTRAEALYPAYHTSALLERMLGRVQVPVILLYPGTSVSGTELSFMVVHEASHHYRGKPY
jgi:hypothetical protein